MKTIIIYATKYGAVEKCVDVLRKAINEHVDVYNVKNGKIPDVSQYDKVIIGGSIYVGKIQREIINFCSENLEILKNKKVGLFMCCMSDKEEEVELQFKASFPKDILDIAIGKERLGGEINYNAMNFFEKFIIRMVSKAKAKEEPNQPEIDVKKGVSMILDDKIKKFAHMMNNA